jgi:eukaryotic-like serine/threonine-protein kinase
MTTPATWSRLDALLDGALSREPHERRSFLDEACRGDAALRARLDELLAIAEADDQDLRPGGGLQGDLAREVLEDLAGDDDVPLPAGTRLGRFEVIELLGAGSVGRVYRARDPALGREVAIKALAEASRADASTLRRFEQEARVLATVNHPNVAGIHGLEVVEGTPYLVLELVEGETLEGRLRSGALPVAEAVEVARQIAAALEAAHRKGIVHRDLKPSNVKLTGPGQVKVLDFGLARNLPPAGETLLADPVTATGPGTVQGTAPYMSPEQARGQPVDAQTDIWAFGCVLFEMLAGRRVFAGHGVAEVLAAVMRDEVDWSALPAGVPPALRLLMERCLRRDVRQRLQDIGDARLELSELDARAATVRAVPVRPLRAAVPWLLAAASLASFLFVVQRRPPPRDPPRRALLSTVETPAGIELAPDSTAPFALSPDGSTIVFRGSRGGSGWLFARRLDELEARTITGDEVPWQPFFSPDGQWVAYFAADRKLKKVALSGGAPIPLLDVPARPRGATWAADGTIVFAGSLTSGLARVSSEGGRPEELTRPDPSRGERSHRWPQAVSGRETVLFTVDYWDTDPEETTIEAVSLKTRARQVVLRDGAYARFLPPRHLVFTRGGRLFAVGFDPDRLVVEGTPRPVLEGVRSAPEGGGTHAAMTDDGTLVYVAGTPARRERHLAWLDVDGRRTRLAGPPRQIRELRLDPRGERVALRVGAREEAEVWVQHLETGTQSQLTFGLHARRPIWTRDGSELTVSAEADGRWRLLSVPVAGGPPRVLYDGVFRLLPADWSPDGRFLAFQELSPGQGWDVAVLEVDAEGRPQGPPLPIVATRALEMNPRFSPDGRWLAYESEEAGAVGIYVTPFGRRGVPVNAAREGHWPVWGEAGELFYWLGSPNQIRRITLREAAGALYVGGDEAVWPPAAPDEPRLPAPIYDFQRSARRFLFFEPSDPQAPAPPYRMTLVSGWGEEVRRRLAAAAPP